MKWFIWPLHYQNFIVTQAAFDKEVVTHAMFNLEHVLARAITTSRGGGVLREKLGMGVRPACQNPYPIYDQNLRFSLSYPDQKFDTLFMT